MADYTYRTPKSPPQLEEEAGIVRRVLMVILVIALAALVVSSLTGCAKPSQALRAEVNRVEGVWGGAIHRLLCEHYRERDSGGICEGQPDGTLDGIKTAWVALCLPSAPEGLEVLCQWVARDIEALQVEVPK